MKLIPASFLAAVAVSDMGNLLIQIVIAGLIVWLLFWFIGWVGLPEPFAKVAKVLVGLVTLIFLINVLLSIGGHPLVNWR